MTDKIQCQVLGFPTPKQDITDQSKSKFNSVFNTKESHSKSESNRRTHQTNQSVHKKDEIHTW